jgi:arsenate reductase
VPDLDSLGNDQRLALRSAAANLSREFEGTFAVETIELFLATSHDQLAANARVVAFLPLASIAVSPAG